MVLKIACASLTPQSNSEIFYIQYCIEENLVDTQRNSSLKFTFVCSQVSTEKKPSLKISSAVHISPAFLGRRPCLAALCGWYHCQLPLPHVYMLCHPRTAISFACADKTVGVPFYPLFFPLKTNQMARSAQVTLRTLECDWGMMACWWRRVKLRMREWRAKERVEASKQKRLVVQWERDTWLQWVVAFWWECEWKLQMLQAPPLSPLKMDILLTCSTSWSFLLSDPLSLTLPTNASLLFSILKCINGTKFCGTLWLYILSCFYNPSWMLYGVCALFPCTWPVSVNLMWMTTSEDSGGLEWWCKWDLYVVCRGCPWIPLR